MVLPPNKNNPEGELPSVRECKVPANASVDTYGGKIQIEWDPEAAVTPTGQLPFFIENKTTSLGRGRGSRL